MATKNSAVPPIAIVGIGLKLPGGITTPDDFWQALLDKQDTRSRVPSSRYNIDAFYDGGKPGSQFVSSDHGYFLKDVDLDRFDGSFFSMSRSEVEQLDPQQRLLLEVVWECMERAGQVNWRGTKIGCYVGSFGEDWQFSNTMDMFTSGSMIGWQDFALSNRLSYEYDLHGPSMTIRTACSSSMMALHEACQALYSGECSGAIVAGVNLIMNPAMTVSMTKQGVLSPEGRCKTFDASADGYARAEAVNAVYIKLLDDAIRDDDPIRAIIRSTAINSDGKTPGITVPNASSHEKIIRRAYQAAGITDLSRTAFFECHGTGTRVGDRTETTAVANVFGEKELYIGSVKPNLGHAEAASGLNSIIKAILTLEHGKIPPNINFEQPNPEIPFERGMLVVPTESTPWPEGREARVSVNSFGIGGSNAHVILESPALFSTKVESHVSAPVTRGNGVNGHTESWPALIPISANNSDSLRTRGEDINKYFKGNPASLLDLAHTLGRQRAHMTHRSFCIADHGDVSLQMEESRRAFPGPVDIVFVFTGQGAQWSHMGKDLIESSPSFRDDIRALDVILQGIENPPSWKIEDILCLDENNLLKNAEFAQPLCTAIQVGLVNFLKKSGVAPIAVVGHSSGEIAGAYAAGAITAREAILISYYRGLVASRVSRKGTMAAIGLSETAVWEYLPGGVTVACVNSPKSVTLSGDSDAVEKALESIKKAHPSIFARKLQVDTAYHSGHMSEVGEKYETLLNKDLRGSPSTVPFYSCVSGHLKAEKALLGPAYWRSNLESPVLFGDAVGAILGDFSQNNLIFLEVGPHAALKGPLHQIFTEHRKQTPVYVSTLFRKSSSVKSLLKALGQIYSCGHSIDFSFINPPAKTLVDLPNYPWDHQIAFWNESRLSKEWRHMKHRHHELLGSRCHGVNGSEPIWRNVLGIAHVPWLRDHVVQEDTIFPAAGYVAMMGEAIRQVVGSEGYKIKGLFIKSGLELKETGSVEILTSMRPSRLTDMANSAWYEFSISSFNGSSWTQHCTGLGKHMDAALIYHDGLKPLPRKVSSSFWYNRLDRWGLKYGPLFQGLEHITACPDELTANATIQNRIIEQGSSYPVHPITLDLCFQLFTVSTTNGLARRLKKLQVPSSIGLIEVKPARSQRLNAQMNISVAKNGSMRADGIVLGEENEIIVVLEETKMAYFPTSKDLSADANPLPSQLLWRPDINFANLESLIRPTKRARESYVLAEKACALYLLRTLNGIEAIGPSPDAMPEHLIKFSTWLHDEKQCMISGDWNVLCPEAQGYATLGADSINALCDTLPKEGERLDDEKWQIVARGLGMLSESQNIQDIFKGDQNALEILFKTDTLTEFYNINRGRTEYEEFFSLCAHACPELKILEIGAGTGSMTQDVLDALTLKDGMPLYSQYKYTDISSGFFSAAQERFKKYSRLSYEVLDISKDPGEQGFELNYYDLIIASNVLHATPSLSKTLANVRTLLRPGGRLFLQEVVRPLGTHMTSFIMGLLPGWWLGQEDGRTEGPLVSVERWNEELRAVGFSGTDAAVLDDDFPYQLNANIVSTAVVENVSSKQVTILHNKTKIDFASDLSRQLELQGFRVQWLDWSSAKNMPDHDIISVIELEDPYFQNVQKSDFDAFMDYVIKLKTGILWLTRSAQIQSLKPGYGLTIGLARTMRSELLLEFSTVELQTLDKETLHHVTKLATKFINRPRDQGLQFEPEFAIHGGSVYVGRYYPRRLDEEMSSDAGNGSQRHLVVQQPGLIDSLQWLQHVPKPIEEHEVEVEVRCAALSFRDILHAMGIIPEKSDQMGIEAAGVVTRVGSMVEHLKPGDRVITVGPGCLASHVVSSSQTVCVMPADMSFEDAANYPIIFPTVIHSIINLGRLRKGESILIHSATGGVGLAALEICKMLEAEIYATVGNDEKKSYLMEHCGIPSDRIFYSRDDSFLKDVMSATNGRGVDMVLNSLSGDLLHASWRCVAEFGKMMEIGKRDFIGRGNLALDPFETNRAFFGIELMRIIRDRPQEMERLMNQGMEYFKQGLIKPIRPVKSFPAEKITEAFHYMQKGQHIGKIVITFPEDVTEIPSSPSQRSSTFSGTATYLLAGGIRGLGKAISTWMVENGARNFVFLSRSAGKYPEDQDFLRELVSQGCTALAVAGSVTKPADVKRAIDAAPSPISGAFQLSMVLKDMSLQNMTYDDWNSVQEPKVKGTWNLHEALSEFELDFFVLFSSEAAVYGQPGQAPYSSANTFLASFVQYRHSLGLPCSVIDVGAMDGVGYISQNPAIHQTLRDLGVPFVQEAGLIQAIQFAIARSGVSENELMPPNVYKPQGHMTTGLGGAESLDLSRCIWKRDVRLGFLLPQETTETVNTSSDDGGLSVLLKSANANPHILKDESSLVLLTMVIGRTLCRLALYPESDLDVTKPLSLLGIDSLVSIEIRNWWRRTFGVDISVLDIVNGGTVEGLGKKAVQDLQERFSAEPKCISENKSAK